MKELSNLQEKKTPCTEPKKQDVSEITDCPSEKPSGFAQMFAHLADLHQFTEKKEEPVMNPLFGDSYRQMRKKEISRLNMHGQKSLQAFPQNKPNVFDKLIAFYEKASNPEPKVVFPSPSSHSPTHSIVTSPPRSSPNLFSVDNSSKLDVVLTTMSRTSSLTSHTDLSRKYFVGPSTFWGKSSISGPTDLFRKFGVGPVTIWRSPSGPSDLTKQLSASPIEFSRTLRFPSEYRKNCLWCLDDVTKKPCSCFPIERDNNCLHCLDDTSKASSKCFSKESKTYCLFCFADVSKKAHSTIGTEETKIPNVSNPADE